MTVEIVTLQIPEILYQRLLNTARATQRPLEEIMLHAIKIGSPPEWDNVPAEFQAEIATLDKLDDNALWQIALSQKTAADMKRYNTLLEGNQNDTLTDTERLELMALRQVADRFMLRKAQAAALLRWRGHRVPTP